MGKLFITLLVAGVSLGGFSIQADPGQDLFKKKMCAACHGPGKSGGDLKGSKMEKAALVKFLKDPKSVKPDVKMPAVKGSDAELETLADYVLTLRK